jgi:hypothetical protein
MRNVFRQFLVSLGLSTTLAGAAQAAGQIAPYGDAATNTMYNLLFCDDLSLFKVRDGQVETGWQKLLFDKPDATAIRALAEDAKEESRIRVLAFNWLRNNKLPVPPRQLLGVIVEVPIEGGLDTLAAYPDGRVRYINHSGKLAIFEGATPQIQTKAKELVATAQSIVNRIGAWDKPRLAPPKKGNIRLTFLVSDGLYFGEGPFDAMQRDPIAAQTIQQATELLQLAVHTVLK